MLILEGVDGVNGVVGVEGEDGVEGVLGVLGDDSVDCDSVVIRRGEFGGSIPETLCIPEDNLLWPSLILISLATAKLNFFWWPLIIVNSYLHSFNIYIKLLNLEI